MSFASNSLKSNPASSFIAGKPQSLGTIKTLYPFTKSSVVGLFPLLLYANPFIYD